MLKPTFKVNQKGAALRLLFGFGVPDMAFMASALRKAASQRQSGLKIARSMIVFRWKHITIMKTNTGQEMAGIPTATPGSAEGVEDLDQQSHIPPSSHTPGSAEGGAIDEGAIDTDQQEKPNSS